MQTFYLVLVQTAPHRLDHIRLLGETGKDLLLSELACYKQVLGSVLQLTIWTTPVPYLINAQSVATIRCIVTHGKD